MNAISTKTDLVTDENFTNVIAASTINQTYPCDRDGSARVDSRWYVLRTQPGKEIQVLQSAEKIGFKGHVSRFSSMRKLMRNGRQVLEDGKPAEEETVKSLFPGYLFMFFSVLSDDWGKLNWLRGALGGGKALLSTGLRPLPVPTGEVEALIARGRAGDGVIDDRAASFSPIAEGSHLRICSGALANHVGICAMSDKDRVELLVSILGAERRVTVSRASVEAV